MEEVRGEVGGRGYHGFVYSATDGQGNKFGNPFKASKIDKSVGAETIEKRFAYSAKKFKEDKKLSEMTKHSVEAVLKQTYHKDKFVELLKAKGIDVVFRHTADGRIYGATFIDHRTQSVFNGSRLGTNRINYLCMSQNLTEPSWLSEICTVTLNYPEVFCLWVVQKDFMFIINKERYTEIYRIA